MHHTPFDPHVLAAPLHRHSHEDEFTYIIEGMLGALLSDEVVEAEAISWVFKPRGQWHTFWNAGDTSCHVIEVISPAGSADYFREIPEGRRRPAAMDATHDDYGLEMNFDSVPELCERVDPILPDA